jgi:hypothetical protein
MSRNKAKSVWLVIFVWCLLFVLLLVARNYTFHSAIVHDEGVFLYGGMAWAAGELPYRDFWDHKPPGITLFHSIPIRLFGYSLPAIRLHEVFWLAISATAFFYLCRAHLLPGGAVLSVLFYCLYLSTRLVIRSGGLTEESALTFHALSYLFALRRRGSLGLNFFLAGLFLGVAAQFRQPFGLTIIFIVLCLLWRPKGSEVGFGKRLRLVPVLALGAAIPEFVCSAYLLLRGIWPEYFEASYLFNFLYMGGGPDVLGLREGMQKHWQMMKATGPYLASPVLALPLLLWLPRRLRRVGVLLILAFLCDFAAISLGGRYYEHYYVQTAISSCFLLGLAFQAVYGRMRRIILGTRHSSGENESPLTEKGGPSLTDACASKKGLRNLVFLPVYWCAAAAAGVCIMLTSTGVKNYVRSYKVGLAEKDRPGAEVVRQKGLGEAVRLLTRPEERILLMGASPTSVYFLGERLAGSRYYHLSPFFRKAFAQSLRVRHRERLQSDLLTRRPALIILAREERQIYFGGIDVLRNSAAAFLLPHVEKHYVPFERDVRSLREIRWGLDWPWYGRYFSFLIRKDMVEEVSRRLEAAEASGT